MEQKILEVVLDIQANQIKMQQVEAQVEASLIVAQQFMRLQNLQKDINTKMAGHLSVEQQTQKMQFIVFPHKLLVQQL